MSAIGQISFPVRVGDDGQVATVDPDSPQFAAQQVEVLCLTPLAWFPGLPGFGLADQRFRKGGAEAREIERQIDQWVPEADSALEHDRTALNSGLDRIGVQVSA